MKCIKTTEELLAAIEAEGSLTRERPTLELLNLESVLEALCQDADIERVLICALQEMYDEMLDEVGGTVNIAGYPYETSYALCHVDPTAYDLGLSDYIDSLDWLLEVNNEYYRVVKRGVICTTIHSEI